MAGERLKIFVCDDDEAVRSALASYCMRLCRELDIPCETKAFADGDALVSGFSGDVDIVLLDIEMPLLNGMDAAREIRAAGSDACIVFTTSFESYAISGYEVGAYRYLLKPVSYERFSAEVRPAFEGVYQAKARKLYVSAGGETVAVAHADIVLVETGKSHRVSIATREGELVAYESMARIERELVASGDFFRCHESFIVGFRHVVSVGGSDVRMDNGRAVPVSRHRKHAFVEAFSQFACAETMVGTRFGACEG